MSSLTRLPAGEQALTGVQKPRHSQTQWRLRPLPYCAGDNTFSVRAKQSYKKHGAVIVRYEFNGNGYRDGKQNTSGLVLLLTRREILWLWLKLLLLSSHSVAVSLSCSFKQGDILFSRRDVAGACFVRASSQLFEELSKLFGHGGLKVQVNAGVKDKSRKYGRLRLLGVFWYRLRVKNPLNGLLASVSTKSLVKVIFFLMYSGSTVELLPKLIFFVLAGC